MVETAVLSAVGGLSPVTGTVNAFTPVRGATTITNLVVIAEKPADIPGEWVAVGMPVTGVTTLRFYKRRDVLVTANVVKSASRVVSRGADQVKKSMFSLSRKAAEKPTSQGFTNLERVERAREKEETIKEKIKEKRYKCRCLVPIDVHYTLQEYSGLTADYAKREKDAQERYVKAKADYDASQTNPFVPVDPLVPEPQPPVKEKRVSIWLFTSARADIGSGLVNSLGESLNFTITLIPQWDRRSGHRFLKIAWKAAGAGMKFSKGFEHSGTAIAILGFVTSISPYDGHPTREVGLLPAPRQDAQTDHHFLRGGYGKAEPPTRRGDQLGEDELPELESDEEDLPVLGEPVIGHELDPFASSSDFFGTGEKEKERKEKKKKKKDEDEDDGNPFNDE
jgi:hypothetical protein